MKNVDIHTVDIVLRMRGTTALKHRSHSVNSAEATVLYSIENEVLNVGKPYFFKWGGHSVKCRQSDFKKVGEAISSKVGGNSVKYREPHL